MDGSDVFSMAGSIAPEHMESIMMPPAPDAKSKPEPLPIVDVPLPAQDVPLDVRPMPIAFVPPPCTP